MAGYVRQSTADIIPTATVRAAPLNAEYNAIRDAFAASGGHKHDGTAAEGDYVPLISDLDNYNKVVIDSTNNRVGVFVEVSAAAVEQVRFQDGAIVPVTTNDIDLGTSSLKFKNLYIEGTATIGDVALAGGTIDDTVIGGTTPAAGTFTTLTATTVDLNGGNIDGTVIGATTAAAADFTTMDASGNATVGGTFGVTGNTTIGGTLGVTGVTTLGTANITSVDLNSGAIDNTTIGAATPAAGTFTVLTANTSLTAATADINGGTLDGVTIGATSAAAATVTDLTASGTSTLTTVDINGGTIDGTTIGASSAAAGSFTTVSTSGQATLATADINGGTVDNTVIGATTPAAITGTTITGTSFVGPVTGNVTGNLTGNVTGNVTGDVTGNITSSGSSSFNNVTIDGTLNMNAGTTATITNLTSPTNTNDAATKGYVDTSISNLVDSAPGTLDTLNELAAALGDDPNFSTTITNSIATKLPLAGGTMTGAIAMSTNKITGLGDPTAAQDAVTKSYAEANFLDLTGGTMTGAIDMGSAKITSTYAPTNAADLTNKTYVDAILGSGQDATAAAAAAATSEANAATSETNAANSATAAASSATSAAASYDSFDDRYLGAKASAPTVDNDGDALINGALYFNTTTNIMNVYGSSGWQSAGSAVNGTSDRQTYTATAGQTVFAATYDAGYVDVYLNGVKLLAGTDFTAVNGTSIVLASGAAVNDIVDIVAYGTFVLADHYTKTQSDARYVEVAGDTMTGNLDITGTLTADGLNVENTSGYGSLEVGGSSGGLLDFKAPFSDDFDSRIIANGTDFTLDNQNAGSIIFNNNLAERMRIDSSGNLLVGSSTYAGYGLLQVGSTSTASNIIQMLAATNGYNTIHFGDATSGTGRYAGYVQYNHTDDKLVLGAGSATRATIDSSGNVGIGTNSPSSYYGTNLVVSSPTENGITIAAQATNNTNYLNFADGTSGDARYRGWIGYSHSEDRLTIGTAASERIRITSTGKVGINNTAPVEDLHIKGTNPRINVEGDGSSYYPSIRVTGVNGGISLGTYYGGNISGNTLSFLTGANTTDGGTRRMYIDSNGRVAIAKTSATAMLDIDSTALTAVQVSTSQGYSLFNGSSAGAGARISITAADASTGISILGYNDAQTGYTPLNYSAADHRFKIGSSEKVRIDSSGHVTIGNTSTAPWGLSSGSGAVIRSEGYAGFTASGSSAIELNRTGNDGNIANFRRNGSNVGSISVTGSSTSYNTSSDYRLKENVTDVTDGITRVKQLAPKRFNFIADPDTTVDGFLAHETQTVVPEAVTGTHNEVDDDNNPVYQGIDQSKLVPLLTAALQEAIAKIEDLEARVAALET